MTILGERTDGPPTVLTHEGSFAGGLNLPAQSLSKGHGLFILGLKFNLITINAMNSYLTLFLTGLVALHAAADEISYAQDAASRLLADACNRAKQDSKMVFVTSGFKECGWCRVFERYHALPEVKQILDELYEVVKIDTKYMPDGRDVFSGLAKPGAPSWVIITPERKVVVDSYSPSGNVGYPLRSHETDHYLKALKAATPRITDQALRELSDQIHVAAGKPRTSPVYTVDTYNPKRNPEEDLKMTVAKAQAGAKRILIQVGGDWCGWCKLMNKYFHENEKVAAVLARDFLIMKVNMSSENANKAFLIKYPPAQGYPHLYVLESNGKFLHSQGTGALEQGKGYNEKTVLNFLAKWAPQNPKP